MAPKEFKKVIADLGMKVTSAHVVQGFTKDEKELGVSGKMDFKPIFDAANAKGLKEYYVEVEQYINNDPFASVKQSFDYLTKAEYVK
ncbi:MAG: hypothetical protein NTY07_11580 [Bacteroidia bacterium]|nr:hypothetical protein [Bacteroidia bacterium]